MSYLRNHKLLLLIIGVLLVANIGLLYLLVFNKHSQPRFSEKEMRERAKERVMKEVGLNAEQVILYDSLRTKQFESMRPLFEDLSKSKDAFFNLIYQNGVSDSVINNYAELIGEKQQAIDLKTFQYFRNIKAICTEEQKPRMDSFIQQIVKRINSGGRRGPGPEKKR